MKRKSIGALLRGVVLAGTLLVIGAASAMTQAELQEALNAGGEVILTSEVLLESTLTFSKSVTLKCVSDEPFKIRLKSWDTTMVAFSEDVTVRLENIIFSGRKDGTCGPFGKFNKGTLVLGPGAKIIDVDCSRGMCQPGGISLEGTARLVMEAGSEISGFVGKTYGTAVLLNGSAVFDMEGGIITGCADNYASATRGYGATVCVNGAGSTFNMSGGVIAGNTSVNACAGVMVWNGTMNLSGDASVTNNVGGQINDLAVQNDDTDDAGGKILVSPTWTGWATFWSRAAGTSGNWYWPRNVYLSPAGTANGVGGRIRSQYDPTLTMDGARSNDRYFYWMEPEGNMDGVPIKNIAEARAMAHAKPDEPHVWEVGHDYNLSGDNVAGLDPTLWCSDLTVKSVVGTHHVLRYGTDLSIYVLNDATYRLRFENITLQGNRSETSGGNAALIVVEAGRVELGAGTVLENGACGLELRDYGATGSMEEGAVIRNCHRKGWDNASALSIGYWATPELTDDSPVFDMTGGVISNCFCEVKESESPESGAGGAVFVRRATFNMTGGLITDNRSDNGVAGVVNWVDGLIRFGGTARVEGNVGTDLYAAIHNGDLTRFVGDFRGHVGVSNASQAEGDPFGIRPEGDATGAWCFFASGEGAANGLIGRTNDGNDPADTRIVWGAPSGMFDGVWYASPVDMAKGLPKRLSATDDRARFPISFSGKMGGTIALDDVTTADEGLVILDSDGAASSGKIAFTLPEGFEDYKVRRSGSQYVFGPRPGIFLICR